MTAAEKLSPFPFFKNPGLQDKILEGSDVLNIKKGETIIREGQYLKTLPLVLKGTIRVFQQYEEREALLYYVVPGETCMMSLSACFYNTPSKSTAKAEEDTEILSVPVGLISGWQQQYPEWNDFIIRTFRGRYDELLESFNSVLFENVEKRIISYLRKYSKEHGSRLIPITHVQLANELGTTRVVTSRILKKCEQEKKIKLLRGKIRILL